MTVRHSAQQQKWWDDDGHWTVWYEKDRSYTAVNYDGRDVWHGLPTLGDALMTVAPADDVQAALALTLPRETDDEQRQAEAI